MMHCSDLMRMVRLRLWLHRKEAKLTERTGDGVNPEVDVIYNGISNPVLVKNGVNLAKENVELNNDAKQKKA